MSQWEVEERDVRKDAVSAHEVMDRAWIVSDHFDRLLVGHAFVQQTPELRIAVERLSGELGALYQLAARFSMGDLESESDG